MTDTKSGRELEAERMVLGSERARRFFKSLGFGPKRDESTSDE